MPEAQFKFDLAPKMQELLGHLRLFFTRRSLPAYLVGGFPRDLVLGRPVLDIDIALAADIQIIGAELAGELGARAVLLDEANGILRLILTQPEYSTWQIDLSNLHGTLLSDLQRRDFTLDALAVDLSSAVWENSGSVSVSVIDPLGGLPDITAKLLRATGDSVFQEDSIRLLRAVRLAAELGFRIEPHTESLVRRDADRLQYAAGERIREELMRLFRLTGTDETLLYMQQLGLITTFLPELAPSIGLTQHGEHQWDVFRHSARSVAAFDFLLRLGSWPWADVSVLDDVPWDDDLEKHLNLRVSPSSTHRELGKLAALLHDIAKPQTRTVSPGGRLRFYGHPQEGALVTEKILERLRFSSREKKLVAAMVRYHLRPVQMSPDNETPTPRAVYRFMHDLGEAAIDTLFFSLADHLATRGQNLDFTNWQYHANIVARVLAESRREASALPARLVDGNDLQRELGLVPGPEIGMVLAELREAQAAGEITSRDEALAYAVKLIKQQKIEFRQV